MSEPVPFERIEAFRKEVRGGLPGDEFGVAALLARSGLFDSNYYAASYEDVDDSGLDPIIHYLRANHARGRKPVPWFDGKFYLKKYPDVDKSGDNPFLHYILHGFAEGRQPNSGVSIPEQPKKQVQSSEEEEPVGLELYDSRNFNICGYEFRSRYYRYPDQPILETDNNLVYITDSNYVMPTIVSANSFIKNCGCKLNIFIMAVNCIDDMAKQARQLLGKGANINIIALNNPLVFVCKAARYISEAALFKFTLPEILYKYDKVLYTDSDTICINNIEDIFSLNISHKFAAVVTDKVAIFYHKRHTEMGLSNYFNSGFMLMNLDLLRQKNIPKTCLELRLNNQDDKPRSQDQDTHNLIFGNNVMYLPPIYNYMTNYVFMTGSYRENFNTEVKVEDIRIIHYSWLKPWLSQEELTGERTYKEYDRSLDKFWHEEYLALFGKPHLRANYAYTENSESRQNEYFRLAQPRKKSVLCIETLHCHGEVMPGFIKYFQDRGYNVDLIWHNELDKLDSLALMDKTRLRKYRNWQFSHEKLLTDEKISQYEFMFFSSRTCYPGNPDGTFPTIYDVHPWLNEYRHKIVNMEHHLDAISSPPADNCVVLANPARKTELLSREVNFPYFGNVKIKREKNSPIRFIVVGNIERHRKNFALLLDTLAAFTKKEYHVDIVAMRNKLEIPASLKDKITFHQTLPFLEMFRLMEKSDYILALLDPGIKEHDRYLKSATSGTFQLAYGFGKPCIIHEAFAAPYYLNEQNSIIYRNNAEFGAALWRAAFIDRGAYAEMVEHMLNLQQQIMRQSAENMDNVLRSANLMGIGHG